MNRLLGGTIILALSSLALAQQAPAAAENQTGQTTKNTAKKDSSKGHKGRHRGRTNRGQDKTKSNKNTTSPPAQ